MNRFLFSLFFACTLIACSPDLPASLTDQPATEDPCHPATPMNPATDCLTDAFVLNEGNMGDPGSLIFISDDGAVKKYNGIAVNPRTGCVWMTTIKGFGTANLTNNILVFDPSAQAVLTANYRNLTRFPAGIFFTR